MTEETKTNEAPNNITFVTTEGAHTLSIGQTVGVTVGQDGSHDMNIVELIYAACLKGLAKEDIRLNVGKYRISGTIVVQEVKDVNEAPTTEG